MKLHLSIFFVLFIQLASNGQEILNRADQMPEFNGNFPTFIKANLKYPESAIAYDAHGAVISQFIVDTTGNISHISIVKSVRPSLDSEALRLISIMPRWKPGIQDGKNVAVRTKLSINFESPFIHGHLPKPGYDLNKFITDHIIYPEDARKNGIQGRVFVKFMIDSTGKIQKPKIVKFASFDLNYEAIRIVKSLPPWQPGDIDGHKVALWFELPIAFHLTSLRAN